MLWSEGRKEEAIKEYKQIIKRCKETKNNKGLVDAYRDCGFQLIQVGRIAEGIEMYKLRLDPKFVSEGSGLEAEYINDLAWAYNYTRDFDAAAEVCISYLKKHDSEVGMQERLANICDSIATFYITAGKNKEAIPYAKKSLLLCNEEPGARSTAPGVWKLLAIVVCAALVVIAAVTSEPAEVCTVEYDSKFCFTWATC